MDSNVLESFQHNPLSEGRIERAVDSDMPEIFQHNPPSEGCIERAVDSNVPEIFQHNPPCTGYIKECNAIINYTLHHEWKMFQHNRRMQCHNPVSLTYTCQIF